jgi:hypothetical protein
LEVFDFVTESPKGYEIKHNGVRINKADYIFDFKDILQHMGVTLSIDELEPEPNTADLVKVVKSDIKTGQNGIS